MTGAMKTAAVFCCLAGCALLALADDNTYTVKAGERQFTVEIAKTHSQRRRGLMHRQSLPASRGLLMLFPREQVVSVWMKNVEFPLDVVWLSDAGVVVDIKTLPPCRKSPCRTYSPAAAARFVLEVGAGLFPSDIGGKVEIIDAGGTSLF